MKRLFILIVLTVFCGVICSAEGRFEKSSKKAATKTNIELEIDHTVSAINVQDTYGYILDVYNDKTTLVTYTIYGREYENKTIKRLYMITAPFTNGIMETVIYYQGTGHSKEYFTERELEFFSRAYEELQKIKKAEKK